MYKQKNTHPPRKRVRKSPFKWFKRKIILLISAFMIGMSNAIYEEDRTIFGEQDRIEQKEDKD